MVGYCYWHCSLLGGSKVFKIHHFVIYWCLSFTLQTFISTMISRGWGRWKIGYTDSGQKTTPSIFQAAQFYAEADENIFNDMRKHFCPCFRKYLKLVDKKWANWQKQWMNSLTWAQIDRGGPKIFFHRNINGQLVLTQKPIHSMTHINTHWNDSGQINILYSWRLFQPPETKSVREEELFLRVTSRMRHCDCCRHGAAERGVCVSPAEM